MSAPSWRALRGRLVWFEGDPTELGAEAVRDIEDGGVLIADGRIAAVAPWAELRDRLPEGTAAGLRLAAELHLITYSAMQAVRFGRYRPAFSYLGMGGPRPLKAVPRGAARAPPARFRIWSSRPAL